MASQLQPRRKDAAKTSRSLFLYNFETAIWRVVKLPLGTFHSAKAAPTDSTLLVSLRARPCNCRWAPSFFEGTVGPKQLRVLKLPLGTFRLTEG